MARKLPGVTISPNHKTVTADLATAGPKIIRRVNQSFKQIGDILLEKMQREYEAKKPAGSALKTRLRHVTFPNPRDPRIPLRRVGWVLFSGDAVDTGSHAMWQPHKSPINKGLILGIEYGAHYEGIPNINHIGHWWASKHPEASKREVNKATYWITKSMQGTDVPAKPVVTAVLTGNTATVLSSVDPKYRSSIEPILKQLRKEIRQSMNRNSK